MAESSEQFQNSVALAKDSVATLSLLAVLGVVYAFDRGGSREQLADQQPVQVGAQKGNVPESAESPSPVRLAVVSSRSNSYDDMGKLLESLGKGYRYSKLSYNDLLNSRITTDYDVLFLTCGTLPKSWYRQSGKSDASFIPPEHWDVSVRQSVKENLRQFVEQGGTLYASDWAFALIHAAFEEFVDPSMVRVGEEQIVHAEVVDSGLRDAIGNEVELNFDLGNWIPGAFRGRTVSALIEGSYISEAGGRTSAGLLVRFSFGDGGVIFTSFHNEKVNSEIETTLLKYLVFSTVTAGVERQITETKIQGGFSRQKQNMLSATVGDGTVTNSYQCEKPGELSFALAFEAQRARLRLTVIAPDGQKSEEEGTSSFSIDIPDAQAGEWQYTITALNVPFDNFPYSLTVLQK